MRRRLDLLAMMWLLSLVCGGVIAQSTREEIADAPEAFRHVASELWNRKIVALADFAHENACPFYSLTQVLSNWLDLAADKSVSLVLVLEETSQTAEILQDYVRTGHAEPILSHLLPYTSLERLEFYQELRDFHLRVERVNEGPSENRRIRFSIRGFEPFSAFGSADGTELPYSSAAQAGDVANERDRRVAAGLTAHLKDHPSDQVLVFYGMDHLRTRPTRQSWAQRMFGSSQQWEPLGYLLRTQLGEQFLNVAQAPFPPAARDPRNPHHALMSRNVILRSADIPWEARGIDPGNFDAVVFLNTPTIDEVHLLRHICSRRVVDCAVERLAAGESQKPNVFTGTLARRTRDSLQLLTGQEFETAAQWRQWLSENPYDGLARVDSDAFAEVVRRECCRPMDRGRSAWLASLGLPPTIYGRQQQITPQEWRSTTWKGLFPRVRFLQCIGICWVGYPAEKEKAREYLVQFSGKTFEDPGMYLKWYRRECLKLAY
ncbi:MAG TPA: hypothetical protein PKH24_09750 [Sedimentisphaerales bacterium]|jgi:hypothetical protein|nr:hypothetical protein [Sedimentisphaerales bacterium]HNU31464.1 hypothetical protein [Sedimentisphaerales bacterium]